MKFKIWHKLAVLLIATTSLTIVIGIGLSQLSFKSGFLDYLQHQENRRLQILGSNLLTAYEEHSNWEFIRNNKSLWFSYLRPRPGNSRFRNEPTFLISDQPAEDLFPDHRMKRLRDLAFIKVPKLHFR